MDNLRKNPPMKFGNYDVTAVRDYLKDEIVDVKTGEKKPTGIPKSNVLYFELTEDAWLCVRPVSYTHLDVYKRQVMESCKCILRRSLHLLQIVKGKRRKPIRQIRRCV